MIFINEGEIETQFQIFGYGCVDIRLDVVTPEITAFVPDDRLLIRITYNP